MTTPCSGTIYLSDVNVELNRSATANIYMGNPTERALAGVPSGTIWMSDFYCKSLEQTYIWTGTGANAGVNLNMFSLFGSPTQSKRFVFINNGHLGGRTGSQEPALTTGIFPAGSTLVFINNGVVSGAGGSGGSIQQSQTGAITHGQAGGPGFRADFLTYIDNSNGVIQGGGGGGGAASDLAASNWYMVQGGGGAGIPGGPVTSYGWVTHAGGVGTMTAGGYGASNNYGGNPAQSAGFPSVVNNDYDKRSMGGTGGPAILRGSLITSDSKGLVSSSAGSAGIYIGRRIDGDVNTPYVLIQSVTGDINTTSGGATVNLYTAGPAITTSVARLSGSAAIIATKISDSQYTFKVTGTAGGNSPRTFVAATYRFTITSPYGSNYYDMNVYVGYSRTVSSGGGGGGSCFTADSIVRMYNNESKRIDEIAIGDVVCTAFGYSEVTYIQTPLLGKRKLLAMPGGKCKTSAEHPIWSRNKGTGQEWWSTRDYEQWTLEQNEAIEAGRSIEGSVAIDITDVSAEYQFATVNGWVDAAWEEIPAEQNLQLYHLHLKDGGGYFVDGYLVEDSGHESENYKYGDQRWRDLTWTKFTEI